MAVCGGWKGQLALESPQLGGLCTPGSKMPAGRAGRLGPPQGPLVFLLPWEGSPSISSCLWPVSQIMADLLHLPGGLPKPADPQQLPPPPVSCQPILSFLVVFIVNPELPPLFSYLFAHGLTPLPATSVIAFSGYCRGREQDRIHAEKTDKRRKERERTSVITSSSLFGEDR